MSELVNEDEEKKGREGNEEDRSMLYDCCDIWYIRLSIPRRSIESNRTRLLNASSNWLLPLMVAVVM